MSEGQKKLGPDSQINEIFDFLRPDEGCGVFPVSMAKRDDGKADMLIVITGSAGEANVMMANLMTYVNEMHEVAEQKKADEDILGTDGKPLQDEPTIIVP